MSHMDLVYCHCMKKNSKTLKKIAFIFETSSNCAPHEKESNTGLHDDRFYYYYYYYGYQVGNHFKH